MPTLAINHNCHPLKSPQNWGDLGGPSRHHPTAYPSRRGSAPPVKVPVSVGGMDVAPGDLLHMDENGAVKFPADRAEEVLANAKAMLEQGMDPDEVGRLVLEAIGSARFWILTHPHWAKSLQKQVAAMVDDQSLSRA